MPKIMASFTTEVISGQVLSILMLMACISSVSAQQVSTKLKYVDPVVAGMNPDRLGVIDEIVQEGILQSRMPGAVVLIGYRGDIVYHKAFGHLQLLPEKVPMQKDTVFDMASLTKPIATATSIMLLVEDGKVDLTKTVASYIPEFAANGKQDITVHQLLVHSGGLIPDNSIKDYADGSTIAFQKIHELGTVAAPGTKFIYTDVGFIVLAEIVERVSGKSVHDFSQERIFQPLAMKETGYLPADNLKARCATTGQREERWIQGEVHDPRAYALGGIAGHAGLFSTASDLAKYCQMMINAGSLNGVKVIKPETFRFMTQPVAVSSGTRALGWDMHSPYSSNRGDLFTKSAFGHGGFTGTAMWIDPEQELFTVFLSNRVHPDGKGSVNTIAGRIATIAGAAIK